MRVSSRFRLRTLIIVVAVVGLTFGLAIELQNRQGRDANAVAEAKDRRRAAWHRDQAALAAGAFAHGRPYSPRQRNLDYRRAARSLDLEPSGGPFPGWVAEVGHHQERANFYAEQAELAAGRRRDFQRRLLWPF